MYILIIARGVPDLYHPLNGIFEFDQAKALRKLGHKVVYIALDLRSFRKKRRLGKYQYKRDDIDIFNIALPIGPIYHSLFFQLGKLALGNIFKDVVKKHGYPDIIHSHFTVYSAIAATIKRKYNIPFIMTEHSSLLNRDVLDSETLFWSKLAYPYADNFITVSNTLSSRLLSHFKIKCHVIHNIIDINSFSFNKIEHENFTFISVGNLVYGKGFDLLISAFASLSDPETKLIIVGDGPLYSKIENQIHSFNLTDQISLVGRKNRSEINKLMSKSDAFILASRGETFGVAYIEAMLAGLPVIGTRCGGPQDFIDEKNGLLVPVDDVSSLLDAMTYMRLNLANYDSKYISDFSRKSFSEDLIGRQITAVYEQTIRKHK